MTPRKERKRILWHWLESTLSRKPRGFHSLNERYEFERRLERLRSRSNLNLPV